MLGIVSLLVIIYCLLFITRVASIILEYTGMSHETAIFQACSAVTGTGFSTGESEMILNNRMRRRVILYLMIIGDVGLFASLSSLLVSVFRMDMGNLPYEIVIRVLILLVGLLILWWLSGSRKFEHLVIWIYEKMLRSPMKLSSYHSGSLCHLANGFQVCEFEVEKSMPLAGKTWKECLPLLGQIKLLGIQRSASDYIGNPEETERFLEGDVLILYGCKEQIIRLGGQGGGIRDEIV